MNKLNNSKDIEELANKIAGVYFYKSMMEDV